MVEEAPHVITSLLSAGLVDRIIVGIAPILVGTGTQAVNGLGIRTIASGIRIENRTVLPLGNDIIVAGDVIPTADANPGFPGRPIG